MKVKLVAESPDQSIHDIVILGFFSDERPPCGRAGLMDWRFNGLISRQMAAGRLTGEALEKILIAAEGRLPTEKILLVGLGARSKLNYDGIYGAGYAMGEAVCGTGWKDVAFEIPGAGRCHLEVPVMTEALVTGMFDALAGNVSVFCSILCDEQLRPCIDQGLERVRRNVEDVLNGRGTQSA